jgi:very-short-patch-repair endonuclease
MPHQGGRGHPTARARVAAVRLRREQTLSEKLLWKGLRKLDVDGTHFREQVPIGPYIADFACHGCRLIIEVDGQRHELPGAPEHDDARDAWLTAKGYRVLRFSDKSVFDRLDEVIGRIAYAAGAASPTPDPSPQGGGEKKR